MNMVEDMCSYEGGSTPEMKHGGGNHLEGTDYDLSSYQNKGETMKQYEVPEDLEGKVGTGLDNTLSVNPRVYRALNDVTKIITPSHYINSMNRTSRPLVPYEYQVDAARKNGVSLSELQNIGGRNRNSTRNIKNRGISSVLKGSDKLTDEEFENFNIELQKIAEGFKGSEDYGDAIKAFYDTDFSSVKKYREKMGLSREDLLNLVQPSHSADFWEKGMITGIKSGLKLKEWKKGGEGLWANVHAKRKRGESPAKKGDKDYPDSKQWNKLTKAMNGKEIKSNSLYERDNYTSSAKKYRRGGESLPKYQSKGQVVFNEDGTVGTRPYTDIEKRKRHRSTTGEFYGGPLSSYEIQDLWCFECEQPNWREGFDPNVKGSEASLWRSNKGFKANDLVTWFYATQHFIPTNTDNPDINVNLKNKTTWEGKNWGYILADDDYANYMGSSGQPGHPLEQEFWFPNNFQDGTAAENHKKNKGQAYAMSRDLRNIPNAKPYFFFDGEPYLSESKEEQILRVPSPEIEEFYNDLLLNLENGTEKFMQEGYLETLIANRWGEDSNEKLWLDNFKKEEGYGVFDELISYWRNSQGHDCSDGQLGCKGEGQYHLDHVQASFDAQLREDIRLIDKSFTILPDNTDVSGHWSQQPIYNNPHEGQWRHKDGTWHNDDVQIIDVPRAANGRPLTNYEIDIKEDNLKEKEKTDNLINFRQYASPNHIGKSFGNQSNAVQYNMLRTANAGGLISSKQAWDYMSQMDGPFSTSNIVNYGLPGAGIANRLVKPVSWAVRTLSKPWGKVPGLNRVFNASAANPFNSWHAINIGGGIYGTQKHFPQMIDDIQDGDYLGASGHAVENALWMYGAPSSVAKLNRGTNFGKNYFGAPTKSLFPQYNLTPNTVQNLSIKYPNISVKNPGYVQEYLNIANTMPRYKLNPFSKQITQFQMKQPFELINKGWELVPK